MPDFWILVNRQPVQTSDPAEYVRFFENDQNRRVARTTFGGIIEVSTVFLGIDHNFSRNGPPILFETMVFNKDGEEEGCWRCSTWDEAEAQHAQVVQETAKRYGFKPMSAAEFLKAREDARKAEEQAKPTVWDHLLADD